MCESFSLTPSTSSSSSSSSAPSSSSVSSSSPSLSGPLSFYGVFDGHGGRQAAIYTKQHLHNNIVKHLQQGKQPSEALTLAYLQTDQGTQKAKHHANTQADTILRYAKQTG